MSDEASVSPESRTAGVQAELKVSFESTPNPSTMKFKINRNLVSSPIHFSDSLKAMRSPLAAKIFGFPWAASVFLGEDFITIGKQDWVDWDILAEPLCGLIKEHIETGGEILHEYDGAPPASPQASAAAPGQKEFPAGSVEEKIKHVLDQEIRPAVAMDGGDILFDRYENQIVYIHMQGACSGCPSATMTLKQGVEARLKELIPEIKEVIALN